MNRSLTVASALIAILGTGCPKKDNASSDASAAASASASSTNAAATTAEPPPVPPPADAAKSCAASGPLKLTADSAGTPEIGYTLKNTGTHPWHYCQVYAFAYDKSGNLLGKGGISENVSLAPGAESASTVTVKDSTDKPIGGAAAQAAVYELIATSIAFDDKSRWEDKSFSFFDHKKATNPTMPLGGAAAASKPAATPAPKPTAKK